MRNYFFRKRSKRHSSKPFQRDYLYLPREHHGSHDICMDLLSQIEEILISDEYQGLRQKTIMLDKEGDFDGNQDILDYLLEKNRKEEHDEIVRNHVVIGLLTDICYFTQEAMTCSIKKRLPVCFAMLRKPFVYTMIVLLRVLMEDGFLDKFNNDEKFDPASISPQDRKLLFAGIVKLMPLQAFTAEDLEEWIFDKAYPASIINLSDAALHLKTTRNQYNATEKQNFNFIFSNEKDIASQWELIYLRMPALMLFLVQISDVLLLAYMDMSDDLFQQRLIRRAAIMKRYQPKNF